jgi:RNA-directed DNA polymerase
VVLIDAHTRHDWLLPAVMKRLLEEFAKLDVEMNEEKSRVVDLRRGESFGFLGFDFRRVLSRRGVWRVQYTSKLKKRTALLRKLKETLRCFQSQPLDRVVELINPALRGWVGYFAIRHSSGCFGFDKASVGTGGVGSGCTRPWGCSMATASITPLAESAASMIGHTNFDGNPTGKRSA